MNPLIYLPARKQISVFFTFGLLFKHKMCMSVVLLALTCSAPGTVQKHASTLKPMRKKKGQRFSLWITDSKV